MLQLTNWSKDYQGKPVLKDIQLQVDAGQVLTLIGPSGSGKSTLLRSINFLAPADQGQMMLDGQAYDVQQVGQADILQIRRKTAMVFQSYALFSKKRALENVMEHLLVVKKLPLSQAKELAMAYLEQVGMKDYALSYPRQLSGGQQQRVGIARALAIKPKLILLDEPTSALDPELIGGILDLIRSISHQEMALLLVTHEMKFARELSDQVIFLDQGKIVEQGSPDQVFLNPQEQRTQDFIQMINY